MILSTVHFHPYLHLGSALGGRVLLKMESPPLYAPWGLFTPLALLLCGFMQTWGVDFDWIDENGVTWNVDVTNYDVIIKGCSQREGDIVIPSKVYFRDMECDVTIIGDKAFYNYSKLTSVTIPEGVTKIGWQAFGHCYGLVNMTIPETVKTIEHRAFNGCI